MERELTRRDFLKKVGGAGLVAVGLSGSYVYSQSWPTLRLIGPNYNQLDQVQKAANEDLPFDLEFRNLTTVDKKSVIVGQPQTWDVADGLSENFEITWPTGNFQPIDTERLEHWNKINPLYTKGRFTVEWINETFDQNLTELPPGKVENSYGDTPWKRLFYDEDTRELTSKKGRYISGMPTTHNMDTLGYNRDVISPEELTSMGALLDPKYKGKVALNADPTTGGQDLLLALLEKGLVDVNDPADLTRDEMDEVIGAALKFKKQGQFRAFWASFVDSVNLMVSGEVVLESMWSPAVSMAKTQGTDVGYPNLSPGGRGWQSIIMINGAATGKKLEAAYMYLNWWAEGKPFGVVGRQGYYSPYPENVKKYLSESEWKYWYLGEPATEPLPYIDGETIIVEPGDVRDGGSYWERMSHVYTWNSTMKNNAYWVGRWSELLMA